MTIDYNRNPDAAGSTWCERVVLAGVFLLPLVCWPGLSRPFSTPKLWLLSGLAAALVVAEIHRAVGCASRPPWTTPWLQHLSWPAVAWLGAIGLSALFGWYVSLAALVLTLVPVPLFLAIRARQVAASSVLRVLAWSSAVLAAVVLLQWASVDPLRVIGWTPDTSGSTRMRVAGTLGNPNFVAAWICATLPAALWQATRRSAWRVMLVVLQLVAMLCTGSRMIVLALPAMAAVLALYARRHARRPSGQEAVQSRGEGSARTRYVAWPLALVAVAVVAVWLSPARPLDVTVAGRYYLARVTAAHLASTPAAGYGPGSFEAKFSGWQVEWFEPHGTQAGDSRFAGLVDHAHNDYLEFWIEYGPVGLLAFLVLLGDAVVRARAVGTWMNGVALAGLASLLVTGLVDFPFHRPAEWALAWVLLAIVGTTDGERVNGTTA